MIIDEDSDRGADVANDVGDLFALVCDLRAGNQEVDKGELFHDGSYSAEGLSIEGFSGSDNDDLARAVASAAGNAFIEVDAERINRGNDDSDIAAGIVVGVVLGDRGGLVAPEADDVDEEPKIAPDEEREEVVESLFTLGEILDAVMDEADNDTHGQDVEGS